MPRIRPSIVRVLLHVGALTPLIILIWSYTQGQLTANPISEIQLRTGKYALLLLTLSLACTPLYNLTGLRQVLLLRRPLGLYAFLYACLHLLNFIGLDYGFNLALLREDLAEKRYILVGFTAFLILLALAITSTRGWVKRLGKNWQRLHWFIYAAGILALIHYLWQIKAGVREPLIYGTIVALLLLLLRLPAVSRRAAKWRRKD